MVSFDKHPSTQLARAFKGYQGQEPGAARYIFMGLDANFSLTIENEPIFPEVLQYLTDGVAYWKETKRHHPFLSPVYKKGSGYRYHLRFSQIGLTLAHADSVSFVELLECPTCGKSNNKRFMGLLDADYLRRLDALLISSEKAKSVFIARGAYARLIEVGEQLGCFSWLPEQRKFAQNRLYTIDIHTTLRVHVITHFSDGISTAHLAEIRGVIA